MSSIVENLIIERIIIHEVFKRTISDIPSTPSYGTELLSMSGDGKQALQQRLTDALGNNSHSIEMEINDVSDTGMAAYTKALCMKNETDFIRDSQNIANKLSEAQISMQFPGGIVVVVTGKLGVNENPFCAIVKAEVHSGFHKKKVRNNISAEYLSDLFLTPQQKLYKIGLFIFTRSGNQAIVYDNNMTRSETKQAAKYFYESFLGCKIADNSKTFTQNFFLLTREFINELDIDSEKKLDYQDSLYSYLKNGNNNTLSISEFSESCLDLDHRDVYSAYMSTSSFPSIAIIKNLDLIKNKLKRRKINFSSGVVLQRSKGSLKDVMQIVESDSESTTIKINGIIMDQIT